MAILDLQHGTLHLERRSGGILLVISTPISPSSSRAMRHLATHPAALLRAQSGQHVNFPTQDVFRQLLGPDTAEDHLLRLISRHLGLTRRDQDRVLSAWQAFRENP